MELKNVFIQDTQGNIIPGATCYLYERDTSILVPGVVDKDGAPLLNPFNSDSNGLVQFAAPNNVYDLRVATAQRDYRLPISCFDTVEGIAEVNELVAEAQAAADAANDSAAQASIPAATLEASLANTADAAKGSAKVGYNQALAYPAGSVGARLKREINVMDAPYNAKLDGVTDDSAAIQAAFDAAPAGSRVVIPWTPTGGLAAGLTINKTLRIVGDDSLLRQLPSATTPLLSVLGVDGLKLKTLKLWGNKSTKPGAVAQTNTLELIGCSNFKLYDVDIDEASYCGYKIDGNTDVSPNRSYLHRVSATRCGYSGGMLYEAKRLNLHNCNQSNNAGFGVFYDSSKADAGSDIVITGGNYDYNGYTGINFPYFNYVGLLSRCGRVQISNASACYNTQNGITLQGKDKTVNGGWANNNGITGLLFNGQQVGVVGTELKRNGSVGVDFGDCEDITCTATQTIDNGDMGIEVNSCLRGAVTGNLVKGNNIKVNGLKAGIVAHLGTGGYPFTGPTSGITFTGNNISGGPNQDYGLLLTADTSDNYVGGNSAVNSGAIADIKCVSNFNTIEPGASRAAHRGGSSATTIATAASVTIPDAAEVVYLNGTANVATITGGNLSEGRQLTVVFTNSGSQILTTGNILTGTTVNNWRPFYLTYVKSLEKWAVSETKTF